MPVNYLMLAILCLACARAGGDELVELTSLGASPRIVVQRLYAPQREGIEASCSASNVTATATTTTTTIIIIIIIIIIVAEALHLRGMVGLFADWRDIQVRADDTVLALLVEVQDRGMESELDFRC